MNAQGDVFAYDIRSETIERVSVDNNGFGGIDLSLIHDINADGTIVAFESFALNLVPGDTNDAQDVFVYDRQSDAVERVSVSSSGSQVFGASDSVSISADGQLVAFRSSASDLIPNDTNGLGDIFVYDRGSDEIERVSIASDGTEAVDGASSWPSLSPDGRYVAFQSSASNLVPGDTNGVDDIFVYDRDIDTVERVSVNGQSTQGNGASHSPTISRDGRFVGFVSRADNLVEGDTNGAFDIFVVDRQHASIQRVSVSNDGTEANALSGGSVFGRLVALSDDGRFVGFRSLAHNLVAGDTNSSFDMFVYDRDNGSIVRVSVSRDGTEGNADTFSGYTSLSADGRFVAFDSSASNLIPNDTNGVIDSFVTINPLIEPGVLLTVHPGDRITDLHFGLIPDPGEISGVVFEDTVRNKLFDLGETPLAGWTVFLDDDRDRTLDEGEVSTTTDQNGVYRFTDIPSFRDYSVSALAPSGFDQVVARSRPRFCLECLSSARRCHQRT